LWFVVRRPELSFDTHPAAPSGLKVVDGLLYQGLDRLEWWDLEGLYASGQLPPDLAIVMRDLLARKSAGQLMALERFQDALWLLRASEEVEAKNEIVCALGADYPASSAEPGVAWLGYDPVYKSGTCYTLLGEVYCNPGGPLVSAAARLNEFGLFGTAAEARDFGEQYRDLSLGDEELAEPLPWLERSFEVLAVGRVPSIGSLEGPAIRG
jgi:hypothetical protein